MSVSGNVYRDLARYYLCVYGLLRHQVRVYRGYNRGRTYRSLVCKFYVGVGLRVVFLRRFVFPPLPVGWSRAAQVFRVFCAPILPSLPLSLFLRTYPSSFFFLLVCQFQGYPWGRSPRGRVRSYRRTDFPPTSLFPYSCYLPRSSPPPTTSTRSYDPLPFSVLLPCGASSFPLLLCGWTGGSASDGLCYDIFYGTVYSFLFLYICVVL